MLARLRAAESIGLPLGDDRFLGRMEGLVGRSLKAGRRGPKPREPEYDWTRRDKMRLPEVNDDA
jgi:putative transposase